MRPPSASNISPLLHRQAAGVDPFQASGNLISWHSRIAGYIVFTEVVLMLCESVTHIIFSCASHASLQTSHNWWSWRSTFSCNISSRPSLLQDKATALNVDPCLIIFRSLFASNLRLLTLYGQLFEELIMVNCIFYNVNW